MTSANYWSESTYRKRLREWGIETGFRDLSTLGGSSQQATPSTQPDTPWEPTPFDHNSISGKDNLTRKFLDEAQYTYATPPPVLDKTPDTLSPKFDPTKDISSLDLPLPPPLRNHPLKKVESPRDIESDIESHASDYSMKSVSTVVSELQVAIDEGMSTWQTTGLTHIAVNIKPVFEHVNEIITGQDEDVVMEEFEAVCQMI
jgi:hypothetical protein